MKPGAERLDRRSMNKRPTLDESICMVSGSFSVFDDSRPKLRVDPAARR